MKPPSRFAFPWRSREQIARDVDTELDFHLQMRVAELLSQGVEAAAARAQATREFGDLEFTRRYCRRVDSHTEQSVRWVDRIAAWRQDVGYAVRLLLRAPGFAIVSIVTLLLAIGANTAVFTVTRAVLLRPLPYGHPDALMHVMSSWPGHPYPEQSTPLSPPDFVDLRQQQHDFTDLAAYNPSRATWRPTGSAPRVVSTVDVSPNMFTVLQAPLLLGHGFAPGDDATSAPDQVVVSYAFWQRDLAGDSTRIGKTLLLDGRPSILIGVMPSGFTISGSEDLWRPLNMSGDLARATVTRKQHWIHAIGRLKPGVTVDAAARELLTLASRLAAQYPASDSGRVIFPIPTREVFSGRFRPALLLLLGGATLVLLIACANLANLTLSRTTARRREMAVRAALGAGRGRIIRQLLLESMIIAAIGGSLGTGFAVVMTRWLLSLHPDLLPGFFHVTVDNRVLLFSLVASLATGVLFGIVPALDAGRADLNGALREGGRGSSGGRAGVRLRRGLVIAQVSLAVVLLIGAGLLMRSFHDITQIPLGYEPSHVLTAQVVPSESRYDSAAVVNRFYDGVIERLEHSPGIVAAGAVSQLPTQGHVGTSLRIEGQAIDEARLPDMGWFGVHGDYFKAMQIPILAGRDFTASDDATHPDVVLINQVAATRYFPKGDAIGHRIRIGPRPDANWWTIIGIVGDVRDGGLDQPAEPALFANHRTNAWETTLSIVVRTRGAPSAAAPTLRRAVNEIDPGVPVRDVVPLEQVLGNSLAARRFSLALIVAFSAVALLLAAVGIYGVLAYSVNTRVREFGLRLALGSTPFRVVVMVLRQGLAWSMIGLGIGVLIAIVAGRLITKMLYGVSPIDPLTYGSVIAMLFGVVLLASLIPAVRAVRVDPLESMRAE